MEADQVIRFNTKLANYPPPAIALTAVTYLMLGFLETLPGTYLPPALYFVALGVVALFIMPTVLGLPNGRKSLRAFCHDIRLLPMAPVVRHVLLGLLMAALTLSGILLATWLTGHFVWDWEMVPPVRWIKGLTRGIWEEVFFRGIILVLFTRMYVGKPKKAYFYTTFVFAIAHLSPRLSVAHLVDLLSIFFMGSLFLYLILKTGSLLPSMVFHYVHDVFVNLMQNAPGANETTASVLLYGFLWAALMLGAVCTHFIARRWPKPDLSRGLA